MEEVEFDVVFGDAGVIVVAVDASLLRVLPRGNRSGRSVCVG